MYEISQYLLKHDWEVEWYALKFWEGPEKIQYLEAIYYGVMVARNTELRWFNIILAGQWPLFHSYNLDL